MSNDSPFETVVVALQAHASQHGRTAPRVRGKKCTACCPAHDDRHPSLSVTEADDGRALLKCNTGCTTEDVVSSLGLSMADLFKPDATRKKDPPKAARRTESPSIKQTDSSDFATFDEACKKISRRIRGSFADSWPYHNAANAEVLRIARFNLDDGIKEFRPLHQHKAKWRVGDPSGPLPLFRLPELLAAAPTLKRLFILEGERKTELARQLGLVATTSAHGSSSAMKSDWLPAAGLSEIVLVPDNDDAGRGYVNAVAQILQRLDRPPRCIRILALPDIPRGGDLVEFVAARGGIQNAAEIAAEITRLADVAPLAEFVPQKGDAISTCMADVEPEELQWLWPKRLPLGKLTLLVGDPGLGKSFITIDLTARITSGKPWPDDSGTAEAGNVILLSSEDDPSDTIRPRLDTAGADVKRVHLISGVAGERGRSRQFSLDTDIAALEREMMRLHPRLVILDPLNAYLGDVDSHTNADVRSILGPLSELAAKHKVTVLGVMHLTKANGQKAMYRTTGSLAFNAAARAVWCVAKDKDDANKRVFVPIKMNLAPNMTGLRYQLEKMAVVWGADAVTQSADDALADGPTRADNDIGSSRHEAAMWLRELLHEHPILATDGEKLANKQGFKSRTLDRAKSAAGVHSKRQGFGPNSKMWWCLPGQTPLETAPVADNAPNDESAIVEPAETRDSTIERQAQDREPQPAPVAPTKQAGSRIPRIVRQRTKSRRDLFSLSDEVA